MSHSGWYHANFPLAPTATFVEKRPGGCRSINVQCQHLGLKYIKLSKILRINGRVSWRVHMWAYVGYWELPYDRWRQRKRKSCIWTDWLDVYSAGNLNKVGDKWNKQSQQPMSQGRCWLINWYQTLADSCLCVDTLHQTTWGFVKRRKTNRVRWYGTRVTQEMEDASVHSQGQSITCYHLVRLMLS